ncbi:MAG: hypothetical protein QM533_06390 [Cytophagales bacterium]|nr:hypothetical protein [Cytophagales bacterium]
MKNQYLKTLLMWIGGAVLIAAAYRSYEWKGVALVVTGIVFWLMLHFTRLMQALKRAANRPLGYIDSAVMLNAKLKTGWSLLHLVALTKSLGVLQSAKDAQPEVFRWTDNGGSYVDCTFVGGKLTGWQLTRPAQG